jgi:5-methyltetrahydropteroyltriglutamate--homocysteine methyltransferase
MRPPFRADQVGSLLRPAVLVKAREAFVRGEITAGEFRAVEDATIRRIVKRQESVGLAAITDGEIRREYWHTDFLRQLDGVAVHQNAGARFEGQHEQPPVATVTGKLAYTKPIMVDDFLFLKGATRRTAKMTIPSPSMLHLRAGRAGISADVYPDIAQFWEDAAEAYRGALRQFAAAGCTYLQLDDVAFAYLGDESFREKCRLNGDDPCSLPWRYAQTINAALREKPAGMTVTMHTCHGNFKSSAATRGGYSEIVEALFSCDADGFFMEFDSEREEGFEPLKRLPASKCVVLGLVTTKVGRMESEEALKRRIDAAAHFTPLENLCLSPQCGFASTFHGNEISDADQWRKLELVVKVAGQVWGEDC